MKRLFVLFAFLLLVFCQVLSCQASDVMPRYVSLKNTDTIGFYQVSGSITLYKEPDEKSPIIHSFSWSKDSIFPENTKFEDLFAIYLSKKDLALMNVTDETEEWVEVVYDNSKNSRGWIKKEDPYRFMSWLNFMNMYGRKYGLYKLQDAPTLVNDVKSSPDDNAQSIGTLNYPEKINLIKVKGNYVLVNVYDLDRTPKTGYIRWRSNEGVKYFFPKLK